RHRLPPGRVLARPRRRQPAERAARDALYRRRGGAARGDHAIRHGRAGFGHVDRRAAARPGRRDHRRGAGGRAGRGLTSLGLDSPAYHRLFPARHLLPDQAMKSRSATKSRAKKESGGFLETAKTIVYAVLIALVVRTVAYEPFNIPSGSMIPTLLVGDYLFVSKFTYGYSRYSLPFGLPLFSGRIYLPFSRLPERGDVVVL